MTINPIDIIENIQKASRIKSQASAVYIYELLKSETKSLNDVIVEDWFNDDLTKLKQLIERKISYSDSQEFDKKFIQIVSHILQNLKQMYKG